MTIRRRKIIGVMGSGSDPYPDLAEPVGRLIAQLGCHLLTGGGKGVMEAVSRAFCQTQPREGLSIGILKGHTQTQRQNHHETLLHQGDIPNPWIEIPIRTHLPLSGPQGRDLRSRNHINVLTADILIVLPGGPGTFSELTLRIDYGRPALLYLGPYTLNGYTADQIFSLVSTPSLLSKADSLHELSQLIQASL